MKNYKITNINNHIYIYIYIYINKILTLPVKSDNCIMVRLLRTLRSVEDALFCADISLPFAEFRFKEKIIN
jgi:hypothetical protein